MRLGRRRHKAEPWEPDFRSPATFTVGFLVFQHIGFRVYYTKKMVEISMPEQEFTAREEILGLYPPERPHDSDLNWGKVSRFGSADKLPNLRLKDITVANFDLGVRTENPIPKLPFDDKSVVVHKLALPYLRPLDKLSVETSPRKQCRLSVQTSPRKQCSLRRWRRVRRQSPDNPLQLNISFLVLATGYSLGVIGLKTAGDCNRKRVWVKDFGFAGKGRKAHQRAFRDRGHSSFAESYLIASDAGNAFSSYRQRTMSTNYDGDRSEDRQSEEVQSAYKRDSDIGEEMIISEEQNDENEWSWVNQDRDGDPLAESVSSLHTTQQVLENEIQKISELGKELEAEESTSGNKDQDVIVLPYEEVDMLELNEKMEHLEQKVKEASNTIREKDLRLSKLQVLIGTADRTTLEEEAASIDQLETELEHHLQEKLEAEIQCLVMLKARQNWQVRTEDRMALEEHRASAGDSTRMLLKLRETESKIVMLKQQVDKLEVREKELYRTTEVLKMQSRTFKVSLFGLVQLIMMCLSLKMFFARVSAPFDEVVPT